MDSGGVVVPLSGLMTQEVVCRMTRRPERNSSSTGVDRRPLWRPICLFPVKLWINNWNRRKLGL